MRCVSRARDALDGPEEGAGVLVKDRARVMVSGVPHESLGTFEASARAFAAIMERREGRGSGA